MADLLLSNGTTGIVTINLDEEKQNELDIDIDIKKLQESLFASSDKNDDSVLISYGPGEPTSTTPGKIYIQI